MKESDVVYAGFWLRFFASVIDSVLVILILSPLATLFGGTNIDINTSNLQDPEALMIELREILHSTNSGFGADFWLSMLLPALATIIFWIYKSATPGKMVLKIKIVDENSGEGPSKAQCIGRYLAYFVSTIPMLAGFFYVAIDKRKQGWHDKLAGTIVIKVDKTSN